jgi:hypothetical protein
MMHILTYTEHIYEILLNQTLMRYKVVYFIFLLEHLSQHFYPSYIEMRFLFYKQTIYELLQSFF